MRFKRLWSHLFCVAAWFPSYKLIAPVIANTEVLETYRIKQARLPHQLIPQNRKFSNIFSVLALFFWIFLFFALVRTIESRLTRIHARTRVSRAVLLFFVISVVVFVCILCIRTGILPLRMGNLPSRTVILPIAVFRHFWKKLPLRTVILLLRESKIPIRGFCGFDEEVLFQKSKIFFRTSITSFRLWTVWILMIYGIKVENWGIRGGGKNLSPPLAHNTSLLSSPLLLLVGGVYKKWAYQTIRFFDLLIFSWFIFWINIDYHSKSLPRPSFDRVEKNSLRKRRGKW